MKNEKILADVASSLEKVASMLEEGSLSTKTASNDLNAVLCANIAKEYYLGQHLDGLLNG